MIDGWFYGLGATENLDNSSDSGGKSTVPLRVLTILTWKSQVPLMVRTGGLTVEKVRFY